MATTVKRIQKDFFLKVLYDNQLPIIFLRNRTEYVLRVERPPKKELFLQADRCIPGLKPPKKMHLMFEFLGKIITFTAELGAVRDTHLEAAAPEFLYTNLSRSHSRVIRPPDLQIQFTFQGGRYVLSFPRVSDVEPWEITETMQNLNPPDLGGLIAQMGAWIKGFASGYTLVFFKDNSPAVLEEKLLAETGKTIYLPTTRGTLSGAGSHSKKRFVTEDMLKRYLESTGVGQKQLDEAVTRFSRSKFEKGILSDIWVPILFQEYVIGYIHLWISAEDLPPPNDETLETLYQFAHVLAHSLKINGYFDSGAFNNRPFTSNVIDISASGLLFAYPSAEPIALALLPDTELSVTLSFSNRPLAARTIHATIRIVRRYTDKTINYYGCRFLDMAPEDTRFLFEFIYGRPFTNADAGFLTGHV